MKRIISTLVAVLLTAVCLAQVPQKFNYQAIARKSTGEFIKNSFVEVEFAVLDGGSSGTEVYKEKHMVNTDANGLISAQVGGGTVLAGDFSKIDWSKGSFWLQTRLDAGDGYELLGAQELLSVPYAIHASVADSIVGGAANDVKISNLITSLDSLEKRLGVLEFNMISVDNLSAKIENGSVVITVNSYNNPLIAGVALTHFAKESDGVNIIDIQFPQSFKLFMNNQITNDQIDYSLDNLLPCGEDCHDNFIIKAAYVSSSGELGQVSTIKVGFKGG